MAFVCLGLLSGFGGSRDWSLAGEGFRGLGFQVGVLVRARDLSLPFLRVTEPRHDPWTVLKLDPMTPA